MPILIFFYSLVVAYDRGINTPHSTSINVLFYIKFITLYANTHQNMKDKGSEKGKKIIENFYIYHLDCPLKVISSKF